MHKSAMSDFASMVCLLAVWASLATTNWQVSTINKMPTLVLTPVRSYRGDAAAEIIASRPGIDFCATVQAHLPPIPSHEYPLCRRPAGSVPHLQGHDLLDDARGPAAWPSHRRLRTEAPVMALG